MIVLAIDPGQTTGWAHMSNDEEHNEILASGSIPTSGNLIERVGETLERIDEIVFDPADGEPNVDCIVIEMPQPWGNYKSESAARRGDLHNLFFTVGAIWGEFQSRLPTHLIKVSTWKGQLSKKNTHMRMCRIYGPIDDDGGKYHRSDAIGLGNYFLENPT